jgi:DNA-binding MarR family transcriptional regulator
MKSGDARKSGMDKRPSELGDYVLEEQVGHLIRRAHQRASAIFAEIVTEHRLTPTQFAALVKIHEEGSASQNQLGRLTAMDPATMQGVVGRLMARGLVARQPDPSDRRRTLLTLTDEGEALVGATIGLGRRITQETLAPLNKREQNTFLRLLKRLT